MTLQHGILSHTHEVDWDTARRISNDVRPLPEADLELAQALGAALAAPVLALIDHPRFDTAAMDGYAVAGRGPWKVIGHQAAGELWADRLPAGSAVEIATGAAVPAGASEVLRYEDATTSHGTVSTAVRGPRSVNIRRAGSDVTAGREVLPPGTTITPPVLGLAASLGHDRLLVWPRPRVGVVVTGAELVRAGIGAGAAIRDAVGPMLPGLVADLGGDLGDFRAIEDHELEDAWADLSRTHDVIVTTGSTAQGRSDAVPLLAARLGIRFRGVHCRPAHPQLLAGGDSSPWLVGLPGNPFAALVAAHTTLSPLLRGLTGRPPVPLLDVDLPAGITPRQGMTRVVPARLLRTGEAEALPQPSSAFLGSAATMDGLLLIGGADVPGGRGRFLVI